VKACNSVVHTDAKMNLEDTKKVRLEDRERFFQVVMRTAVARKWPHSKIAGSKCAVLNNSVAFSPQASGIVGSNPTRGMDVCVRSFYDCVVMCVGSGLATG
jgi:hypothetical protein